MVHFSVLSSWHPFSLLLQQFSRLNCNLWFTICILLHIFHFADFFLKTKETEKGNWWNAAFPLFCTRTCRRCANVQRHTKRPPHDGIIPPHGSLSEGLIFSSSYVPFFPHPRRRRHCLQDFWRKGGIRRIKNLIDLQIHFQIQLKARIVQPDGCNLFFTVQRCIDLCLNMFRFCWIPGTE